MRQILGFIGTTDVTFIAVDNTCEADITNTGSAV